MSWKDRLTRPRWEHKDPEIRARAVAELDDPRMARALPEIIESDPDAAVRLQALRRLDDETLWLRRAEKDEAAEIRTAADERVLRYLRRPAAGDAALQARHAWLARQTDPARRQSLAVHAADPGIRRAALEAIAAQGFLGDRVIEEPDDEIAAAALARIDQTSTLKRIAGALRKRNKKRHQNVVARLDELDPDHDGGEHASAEALCRAAEALARGDHDGDRETRRAELEAQWETAGRHASETQQRRFAGAMEIIARAGSTHPTARRNVQAASETLHRLLEADDEAAAKRELEAVKAALDEAGRSELASLIEQAELHLAALDATPHEELSALARTITGLRDASETPIPDRVDTLTSRWDRAWNRLDHPTQADNQLKSEVMGALAVLRERVESRTARQPDKPDAPKTDPGELLDRATAALDDGELASARKLLNQAHKAIGNRKGGPAGRMHQLEGRLKEMRDWQHWSNNRIRERIIREVDELPAAGHHPDALVARLKDARRQWQDLEEAEHLPGDRRMHAAPPGLWRKFQAVCKSAHEAAQPFFDKRQEIQARHKEEIEAFINEADALGDDAAAPELRKALKRARQSIRRLDEIPPADRSRTAKRLRRLMDGLGGRLDTLNDQVEKAKLKLINEARQLEHETDRKAAVDKAKALQKQWQAAGSLGRKKEQKLWIQFREPIDPLFDKEKAERDNRDAERRERDDQARALIKELRTLVEDTADESLEEQAGPVAGLESRWQVLTVRDRKLQAAFQDLVDRFSRRRETIRDRARQDRRDALIAAGELLQRAHEQQAEGTLDVAERDALAARWRALSDQAPTLPENLLASLLDNPVEPGQDDEDAARELLVQLEFLAGIASPEADRQRRMDYQVRRLSNRLGGNDEQTDPEQELESLLLRWLDVLPVTAGLYGEARKRLDAAVKELQKQLIK